MDGWRHEFAAVEYSTVQRTAHIADTSTDIYVDMNEVSSTSRTRRCQAITKQQGTLAQRSQHDLAATMSVYGATDHRRIVAAVNGIPPIVMLISNTAEQSF